MTPSDTYNKTTQGIRISVRPIYLDQQSDPAAQHYVWAYQVHIENQGEITVQLINRHWKITDANGTLQEVRGPGVVGEQPVLEPGDSFDYTSGTPLTTSSGVMHGWYEMETDSGERFQAEVPMFSLDSPHERRALN
jgi:ApaG protein